MQIVFVSFNPTKFIDNGKPLHVFQQIQDTNKYWVLIYHVPLHVFIAIQELQKKLTPSTGDTNL